MNECKIYSVWQRGEEETRESREEGQAEEQRKKRKKVNQDL